MEEKRPKVPCSIKGGGNLPFLFRKLPYLVRFGGDGGDSGLTCDPCLEVQNPDHPEFCEPKGSTRNPLYVSWTKARI